MSWSTRLRRLLDHLRVRLSGPDGGLLLAMLGLLCGLVAGAVLVAFRFGIETAQSGLLSGAGTEGYEALSPWWRLGLCVAGGILVGGLDLLARQRNQLAHRARYARIADGIAEGSLAWVELLLRQALANSMACLSAACGSAASAPTMLTLSTCGGFSTPSPLLKRFST